VSELEDEAEAQDEGVKLLLKTNAGLLKRSDRVIIENRLQVAVLEAAKDRAETWRALAQKAILDSRNPELITEYQELAIEEDTPEALEEERDE
jgi:hypothetical protein